MKRLFKILIIIFSFYAVQRFCHRQTDGFTPLKIHSTIPYHSKQTLASEEVLNALSQPYFYLARGAQAYAFVSQDGRYVIKFFRHRRMHNLLCQKLTFLPSFVKDRLKTTAEKKSQKFLKDYQSYELAFEKLREETGLLYLHLGKTSDFNRSLTLYDKIHIRHELPLDELEFIIQKRADLFYPALEEAIEFNPAKAKLLISQLVTLLKNRIGRNIFDKDPELETNFGVSEERVIQIDVGRFSEVETADPLEIYRITNPLRSWLQKKAPELETHLNHALDS